MGIVNKTFKDKDLASLDEQVAEFVDELLQAGTKAWSQHYRRLAEPDDDANRFICTVDRLGVPMMPIDPSSR